MDNITLTIDEHIITTKPGTTVLQAARQAGIFIPTICAHKDLNPYGACRMCVVEIEGVRGFPTACTTPVSQNMQVRTQSEQLQSLRKNTLEMMFSGHPNSCLVCPHREACEQYRPKSVKAARSTRCGFCANRDSCELRDMALHSGPRELKLPTLYSGHLLERNDPFMDRDYNLCILCGRCWRICEKIHGTPAISIINRGKWARIGTAFNRDYVHSGCTFCGACIDICPTGTLADRFAQWRGKPEQAEDSLCMLCGLGCSVRVQTKAGELLAHTMPSFAKEKALCALGRFGTIQILASEQRLIRPQIREEGEQIPVDLEAAIGAATRLLLPHKGKIALLVSATSTREDFFIYEQLARVLEGLLYVVPAEAGSDHPQVQEAQQAIEQGKISAILCNGPFLEPSLADKLDALVMLDCLASELAEQADVLIPIGVLDECGGSFRNSEGIVRKLACSAKPPRGVLPEWRILCQLATALGVTDATGDNLAAITAQTEKNTQKPVAPAQDPRKDVQHLNPRFRGHLLADIIPALQSFGLPTTPRPSDKQETGEGGFAILEKREIVPNMHFFKVHAPQVARFAKPGQFAILMAGENSERAPFTLVDWDAEEGSISLIIEEVGRSTRELASLSAGHKIAHISGPLGVAPALEKKGRIFLGGGCYGIGAIYPLARALKAAGNEVICCIEASSDYLLYMEKEIAQVCDQLIVATKDGSRGIHGGVQEAIRQLVQAGKQPDQCIAIGCTFMMRMVSELTRELNIPTLVALNPIMVDGTGMCGACRVSVNKDTRFACVDGPIFDAHAVDWDELDSRRSAYAALEVQALPQCTDLSHLMWQPQRSSRSDGKEQKNCACAQ